MSVNLWVCGRARVLALPLASMQGMQSPALPHCTTAYAHYTKGGATHAALAWGSDKALPFRGAMGLEAPASLARHRQGRRKHNRTRNNYSQPNPHISGIWAVEEAWPTMKGLADSQDDGAEWAGRKPDGKALRMPTPAQLPSLQRLKQMQRGPLHRCDLQLLQTLPACAAAPARWRQHGSQHGLVQRSSRQ